MLLRFRVAMARVDIICQLLRKFVHMGALPVVLVVYGQVHVRQICMELDVSQVDDVLANPLSSTGRLAFVDCSAQIHVPLRRVYASI